MAESRFQGCRTRAPLQDDGHRSRARIRGTSPLDLARCANSAQGAHRNAAHLVRSPFVDASHHPAFQKLLVGIHGAGRLTGIDEFFLGCALQKIDTWRKSDCDGWRRARRKNSYCEWVDPHRLPQGMVFVLVFKDVTHLRELSVLGAFNQLLAKLVELLHSREAAGQLAPIDVWQK